MLGKEIIYEKHVGPPKLRTTFIYSFQKTRRPWHDVRCDICDDQDRYQIDWSHSKKIPNQLELP